MNFEYLFFKILKHYGRLDSRSLIFKVEYIVSYICSKKFELIDKSKIKDTFLLLEQRGFLGKTGIHCYYKAMDNILEKHQNNEIDRYVDQVISETFDFTVLSLSIMKSIGFYKKIRMV